MIVVTSGMRYLDIDAYACIVAYAELLRLQGKDAVGASSATLNETITQRLRALDVPFSADYQPAADDSFVIVDLSNPNEFDPIVDAQRVAEVFDHHTGFEAYWSERLGDKCHIEFIGAAATLIYERWVGAGVQDRMSQACAELLAAAILDNTLNFGAGVTTERDKRGFEWLAKHANLDEKWVADYFTDCQQSILDDLVTALRNDTKYSHHSGLNPELSMGQLALWDARSVIGNVGVLREALASPDPDKPWLANVISISEGRSYFVSDSPGVHTWLEALIGVKFAGSIAIADRLWLRKEVLKAAQAVPVS